MVNFFNVDCIEFMKSKPDKFYDLAIVDPPYGDFNGTIERTGGAWSKKYPGIAKAMAAQWGEYLLNNL